MRIHIRMAPFIVCRSLTNEVACNALVLLLQRRVQKRSVGKHRLVVTLNVHGALTWDPHHAELVTQASQVLA